MKVRLLVVGKVKEKAFRQGIEEYIKRLSRYTKVEIQEVKDEPTKENLSPIELENIINQEGERLLSHIKENDYVVVLEIKGKLLTSEEFANDLKQAMLYGKSTIDFVIGGSLGTSKAVNKRADLSISFGRMTYPHQLMRLILAEQIYRAFRIMNNEPYHK